MSNKYILRLFFLICVETSFLCRESADIVFSWTEFATLHLGTSPVRLLWISVAEDIHYSLWQTIYDCVTFK